MGDMKIRGRESVFFNNFMYIWPIKFKAINASVPLGIFASAMVKCIIIHVMLPDALRF